MVSTNPFKELHQPSSFTKKLIPWTLYVLLPLVFFRLYFYPVPLSLFPADPLPPNNVPILITTPTSPPPPSATQVQEKTQFQNSCDYSNGRWVPEKVGPLYNGTSCGTIKEGQNCMSHGRGDVGYLYWRWQPNGCQIPRFEPTTFLQLMRNKHLAFVGDSLARNQMESLLCLLSSASSPVLLYTNGEDNKFRRWNFPSHNVNVSIYWSPFLVKGIEKSGYAGDDFNRLFLDSLDEKWAADLGHMDMVVLSIGHWFLHPAVYHYGGSVLGCHHCVGKNENYTEIGFFDVFGKAVKTTLKTIIERRGGSSRGNENGINVVVTTFSPAHFEGEWDKLGACSKTKPYEEGEKTLEGMDADMRKVEVDEVELAKKNGNVHKNLRIEALDVTKLALMRPDGHPGPYMYPFPFANGVPERVLNDCVHWCLPGPIDTWNEILLDLMKRWAGWPI